MPDGAVGNKMKMGVDEAVRGGRKQDFILLCNSSPVRAREDKDAECDK